MKNIFLPKVSIGVPIYNESENIEELIESILAQVDIDVSEVIFIASGCTDDSVKKVKSYVKENPHFVLIEEARRNGKATAINLFLARASGDIRVILSSDIVLDKNCLSYLIGPFQQEDIGMTGAHAVPVSNSIGFVFSLNRVLWGINNQFNKKNPKLGEAVACRATIGKIPCDTAVDEASIEAFFSARNYRLYYEEKALIYNMCPITLRDLVFQRIRIFCGHLDTKTRSGYAVGSMDLKLVGKATFSYAAKNPHLLVSIFCLCLLEAVSRLVAYCKYCFYKEIPPFIWPTYKKG